MFESVDEVQQRFRDARYIASRRISTVVYLAARMGRFDVLAVAVIAGDPLAIEASRAVDAVAAIAPSPRPDVMMSAAALPGGGGCVVRLAGERVEAVRQRLRGVLDFVPALLGDDPWARKW